MSLHIGKNESEKMKVTVKFRAILLALLLA